MLFLAKHMLPLLQQVFNINIPSIIKPASSMGLWALLFSRNFSGLLLFLAPIQQNPANDALGTTPLPVVFSFALILLFSCKEFVACGTSAREPYYEILHCSFCLKQSPRIRKKIICCFLLLFPSLHGPQIKPSWPFVPLAHASTSGESGVCFGLVFHLFLDSKKTILFVRAAKNGEANCCC